MRKPIAHMTAAEIAAYTPEQMADAILDENFDPVSLSRGMALNLSRDILDCLRAYGDERARREREIVLALIAAIRAADQPGAVPD